MEEELEEYSKTHKIAIAVLAVLLIILMLSWVFVMFPVGEILASHVESKLVIEKRIVIDGLEIIFSDIAYAYLQKEYFANPTTEVSLCLSGTREDSKYNTTRYFIDSFYKPVQEQSFAHVRFEPCSTDTLIMLHTHPRFRCIASPTDINTLRKTQEYNPSVVMVVMCKENRVSVYR